MPNTKLKILVVGDGMMDVWWVGSSTRTSAEAPIPIVKIDTVVRELGGAGNVLMNLLALGANPIHGYGEGPIKNRLLLDGVQIARWDEHDYCEAGEINEPFGIDGVIISDYSKGGLDLDLLQHFDGPFFIDSKRSPLEFSRLLPGEHVYFPNSLEYTMFSEQYDALPTVVHKRGSAGIELLRYGVSQFSQPALCKHPVSVCGAGDTVVAAFAKRFLETRNPRLALAYANAAAAVVVGKEFTSTSSEQEISEYLRIYES